MMAFLPYFLELKGKRVNIQALINDRVSQAIEAAGAPAGTPALVRQSAKAQFGDYQANGIMGAAKQLGTNPREFAQKVLDVLNLEGIASKTEIAGPGFINIFLSEEFWLRKPKRLWRMHALAWHKKPQKPSWLTTQRLTLPKRCT